MNNQYSHTEVYQSNIKTKCGPGGITCRCCYPASKKKGSRRIARRNAKHNLRKEVICADKLYKEE